MAEAYLSTKWLWRSVYGTGVKGLAQSVTEFKIQEDGVSGDSKIQADHL